MPINPMHYNYHVLAAKMYARQAALVGHQLSRERNPSNRRWLQRRMERLHVNTEWHRRRAMSGAVVPDDVAALAKKAWRLRIAARKAESTEKRKRKWEKYRLTMQAAGHALKEHLRSASSDAIGAVDNQGAAAISA